MSAVAENNNRGSIASINGRRERVGFEVDVGIDFRIATQILHIIMRNVVKGVSCYQIAMRSFLYNSIFVVLH